MQYSIISTSRIDRYLEFLGAVASCAIWDGHTVSYWSTYLSTQSSTLLLHSTCLGSHPATLNPARPGHCW